MRTATYADVLAAEEDVGHVDDVDVQTVFELLLEFLVFVQIALFVANAMVLQDLFHSLALVERQANDLERRGVNDDLLVLFLLVVSLCSRQAKRS